MKESTKRSNVRRQSRESYSVVSPYNERVATGLSRNDAANLRESLQTSETFNRRYTQSTYPFYVVKDN